jgi:FkbM family methyltransferase
MIFKDLYTKHQELLNVFCEVGVYFWDENGKNYCRFSEQANDNKQIILVEPLSKCIENINLHIKDKNNVVLYPYAISNKSGFTTIYDQGAGTFIEEVRGKTPYDIFWSHNELNNKYTVKTITFDEIDPENIDVLFIDTEGGEYFVLQFLKSRPKIIAIETHYSEHNNHYINPYIKEIREWMENNNYEIWYTDESDSFFINKNYKYLIEQ